MVAFLVTLLVIAVYLSVWAYLGTRISKSQSAECRELGCGSTPYFTYELCLGHGVVKWTALIFWPALPLAYLLKYAARLGNGHSESRRTRTVRRKTLQYEEEAARDNAKAKALAAHKELAAQELALTETLIRLEKAKEEAAQFSDFVNPSFPKE